ncbi:MAG: hypothetical protein J3Q66DRAFT_402919 [Benniella sp.]|nr:MAG: hypothetical protein J3Q66DRAFT_402919 [Benniella sp.]
MDPINPKDIQDFCDCTSADIDVANRYLSFFENLDEAVTYYMETGGADLVGVTPSNSNSNKKSTRRSRSPSNDNPAAEIGGIDQDEELARLLQEEDRKASASTIRAPIAPRHDMLIDDDYGNSSTSMFGGRTRAPHQTSVFLPPDSTSRVPEPFRDFAAEAESARDGASPRLSKLAELFKAPTDIMAKGSFDHCRNIAKKEKKWLMVNIQDAGVFACQLLNRDLWSVPYVKEVVKENFIFLQFYSDSAEGKKYATFYPLNGFPHIAIIDPRTAERVHTWGDVVEPDRFQGEVELFLEEHSLKDSASTPSQPKKKKLVKDVSDMTEEEQLQAAMLASMGGDSSAATAMEQMDDEETPSTSVPEEPAPVEDEEVEEEKKEEEQGSVFDRIQPVRHEEPTDPATSTRLGFRLSDGSRLTHRFSKDAPVRVLFEFIKAEVEDARSQPFDLVFQRKQLLEDIDKSLAEAGIENAQIMVQM